MDSPGAVPTPRCSSQPPVPPRTLFARNVATPEESPFVPLVEGPLTPSVLVQAGGDGQHQQLHTEIQLRQLHDKVELLTREYRETVSYVVQIGL